MRHLISVLVLVTCLSLVSAWYCQGRNDKCFGHQTCCGGTTVLDPNTVIDDNVNNNFRGRCCGGLTSFCCGRNVDGAPQKCCNKGSTCCATLGRTNCCPRGWKCCLNTDDGGAGIFTNGGGCCK